MPSGPGPIPSNLDGEPTIGQLVNVALVDRQTHPAVRSKRSREERPWCEVRYHQAKETKCDGTGDRSSDCLIVPLKLGNLHPEDPVEGRRAEGPRGFEASSNGTTDP